MNISEVYKCVEKSRCKYVPSNHCIFERGSDKVYFIEFFNAMCVIR